MSLKERLSNGNVALQCDICNTVSFATDDWYEYGSILHRETCPDDPPHACSDTCKIELDSRIKSGDIKIPGLKNEGWYSDISTKRKGY